MVVDKVRVRVASIQRAVIAMRRPGCRPVEVPLIPHRSGSSSAKLRRCVGGGMLGLVIDAKIFDRRQSCARSAARAIERSVVPWINITTSALTSRRSGRVKHKVPSPINCSRAARINRYAATELPQQLSSQ